MREARVAGTSQVDWMERAAIGASLACLVHCLALPLLIALLPVLSAILYVPEAFHLWVLGLAVPSAGFALWQGRSRHGARHPLIMGACGLVLLAAGALLLGETAWEAPVTTAGSVLLASAHIINWRLRHACC